MFSNKDHCHCYCQMLVTEGPK